MKTSLSEILKLNENYAVMHYAIFYPTYYFISIKLLKY